MTYQLYFWEHSQGKEDLCVCEQELCACARCGHMHDSQDTHSCKCPSVGDGQTDMLSLNGKTGTLLFVPVR